MKDKKLSKALEEVVEELCSLPRDKFLEKIRLHADGDISIAVQELWENQSLQAESLAYYKDTVAARIHIPVESYPSVFAASIPATTWTVSSTFTVYLPNIIQASPNKYERMSIYSESIISLPLQGALFDTDVMKHEMLLGQLSKTQNYHFAISRVDTHLSVEGICQPDEEEFLLAA